MANKTFLVCDDSILARKQVKDAILAVFADATVIEGKNGQEAVDLYKEHKPDLVFLDIVMPEKDGTSAVSEICSFDANADVIIVSSVGTQSQLKAAITAGAKDFIQKPVDKTMIKEILTKRLGGQ